MAVISMVFFATPEISTASAASGDAITYVKEMNYMSGYPDGSFGADQTINRAELTKIIVSSLFMEADIDDCMSDVTDEYVVFKDIPKDKWFAPYICVAAKNGLITGYEDGTFRAGDRVTFAESAKIILSAFDQTVSPSFDTYWFAPFVGHLSDHHAIPTSVTSLVAPMTRGEIAEILYRIDNDILDLPSNAYEPTTVCVLEMEGRFYGKTAKDVFFYTPTHALYSSSGALFGSESRKETLIAGNGRLIAGADVKTFEGLEMGYYGKDASKAYYIGEMLRDSDGRTFETIDTLFGYAKDQYSGYFQGQKVLGSDPVTFESLGAYFAKDKNAVYYFGQKFEGADASSFEVINGEYQRDKNTGYFRGMHMESDGASFEVLNVSFAKDAYTAYFQDTWIKGSDPLYFQVLKDHYSMSDNDIFFENASLGADAESFVVLDDYYAVDETSLYYGATPFVADKASFQVIAKGYAKDKDTVYYKGGKIDADASTFSVSVRGIAKDKSHTFVGGIAQ